MRKPFLKGKLFLLTVFLDFVLVLAILFLMNYVQFLLDEDARINLTEIVTQNKDVITSRISMELNDLEFHATQLGDRFSAEPSDHREHMEAIFLEYAKYRGDFSLVWSNTDGDAISGIGKEFSVADREYFNLGISSVPSVSERILSRADGADVFVVCVPLVVDGQIAGTIQKQYTPQEMYSICSIPLFSKQGSSYIINAKGNIQVSSDPSLSSREADSYYSIIHQTDPVAAAKLKADIEAERSGFMDATIDGQKVFFTYTPIEGVYDWYLISSIPTSVVSPNGTSVIHLFYFILFTVALLVAFTSIYYLNLKRRQQLKLEHIAFVDPVTGGNSYTKFTLDLASVLGRNDGQQYHICTIDIDNFKYINNFYGFDTGDGILRTLYTSYNSKLTANECVSRVNADHFVLLLSDISDHRLNDLIPLECTISGIKLHLSAGIYTVKPTDSAQCANLMMDKAATAARRGKNLHTKHIEFYSDELFWQAERLEQVKRGVEQALEHNEIVPFFQPKVNIDTGKLLGAEALARWIKRDGTMMLPSEFIPVCEDTGLIVAIDYVIFEKTLSFIRDCLDSGIECVPISVNFSRLHLMSDGFIDHILAKLSQYGVPPELIELELTETVIFDNFQTINDFIKLVHSHGLKISMDDFGTGNSSLSLLKDIEIDVLKIDRGFLIDTENNQRQKTIFGTIVAMANKLNIRVVVEGVETLENVNVMKEFSCECAQGYFYSKPVPIEIFKEIYHKGCI